MAVTFDISVMAVSFDISVMAVTFDIRDWGYVFDTCNTWYSSVSKYNDLLQG